jgi:hypothetical protein
MTLIYHRYVQRDVSAVLAYYDEVGGPELGDAFYAEFMAYIAMAHSRSLGRNSIPLRRQRDPDSASRQDRNS